MTQRAIVSLLSMLLLSPLALVQAAPQDDDGAALPVMKMPVNIERVKRTLAALPDTNAGRSLLKLNYYLEVYARAPQLNLLQGFDLDTGPVPFGGPSHADMRALWTPEEFSAPVADLGALFKWISKR